MEPSLPEDTEKSEIKSIAGGGADALSGAKDAAPLPFDPPDGNTGGNCTANTSPDMGEIIDSYLKLQEIGRTKQRYVRCSQLPDQEPQMVYREIHPDTSVAPNIADIDWLNLVFQFELTGNSLTWLNAVLVKYIGYGLRMERTSGKFNYDRSWTLKDGRTLFCVGGAYQNDTALISFPGDAVQFIDPFNLISLGGFLQARITRVDICKDFFLGEYTIEQALDDYEKGRFRSRGAGRNPSKKYIESSSPDGNDGRTLYVGKRENGKLIRVYEKGLQMGLKKSEFAKWVRVEFEIHNTDREIPWEVIVNPGPYLAGSCEAMGFISGEQSRVKTITAKIGSTFYKAVESARLQYGLLINTMLDMGLSDQQIVGRLRREGFPEWYQAESLRNGGISPGKILRMVKDVFGEHLEWEEGNW